MSQTDRLTTFNRLPTAEAAALVRPCLDVDRWVEEVVAGRPYAAVEDLIKTGRQAASSFTRTEVEQALAHHPRIGERASGASAEASLSRSEQAGLTVDDDTERRLAAGNRAYEERCGRVFLIRAAARSAEEESEQAVVADQLRQIALLRLSGAVAP